MGNVTSSHSKNTLSNSSVPVHSSPRNSSKSSKTRRSDSYDTISTSAEIAFFDQFGPEHAKKIKKLFERKLFPKDAIIAEQGTDVAQTYGLFIIVSGEVHLSARGPDEQIVSLKTLSKGQWFGVAQIQQGVFMPMTATASTDCTMLVLPMAELDKYAQSDPDMALTITAGNKSVSLATIPFFDGIDIATLHQLASLFEYRRYKANRYLYRQGDPANGIYITVSGTVAMVAIRADGTEMLLSLMGKSEYFGELALYAGSNELGNPIIGQRTMSVRTLCDSEFLYLSSPDFAKFVTVAPHVIKSAQFRGSMQRRTASSLKGIPFFSDYERKQIGPLQKYDEDALNILGELFEYVHFQDKYQIFAQGSTGDAFYLIVSGAVEVTSQLDHGAALHLATLTEGDWFGEISLIMDTTRTATVTTIEQSVMLMLTKDRFQKVMAIAPHLARRIRQRLMMRTADWLKQLPFFSGINENKPWSKLGLLGTQFRFRECCTGEVVCSQGVRDDRTFYLIVLGKVRITILDEGQPIELDTLGESQWFGEISLLNDTPRTATVTCTERTLLCYLTLSCFEKFMDVAPELRQTMSCLIAQRTSNTLRSSFPIFKHLKENKPWSKLAVLASLMVYRNIEPDVDVLCQGVPVRSLYFILKGRVILSVRHPSQGFQVIVMTLSDGQIFGEVALSGEAKSNMTVTDSSFTVRTIDECTFLELSVECFRNFLSMSRELIPALELMSQERYQHLQDVLQSTMHPIPYGTDVSSTTSQEPDITSVTLSKSETTIGIDEISPVKFE